MIQMNVAIMIINSLSINPCSYHLLDWSSEFGGVSTYIVRDEDEQVSCVNTYTLLLPWQPLDVVKCICMYDLCTPHKKFIVYII